MKLDVMPIDENILGFSNRWYKRALREARTVSFEGLDLRVVTPSYFLATKLEAFKGRGKRDFYASKDLEDIVTVIDGRRTVVDEVGASDSDVRRYIGEEIRKLLSNREFMNALPGYVLGDEVSQARIPIIVDGMKSLSQFGAGRRRAAKATKPSRTNKR